jgi:hypothetical protein
MEQADEPRQKFPSRATNKAPGGTTDKASLAAVLHIQPDLTPEEKKQDTVRHISIPRMQKCQKDCERAGLGFEPAFAQIYAKDSLYITSKLKFLRLRLP